MLVANGLDYLFGVMDVTFLAGSQPGDIQHIFIPLMSDNIIENTESFHLHLSSLSPLSIIDSERDIATVEIRDTSG